jgi:hypothetical protein
MCACEWREEYVEEVEIVIGSMSLYRVSTVCSGEGECNCHAKWYDTHNLLMLIDFIHLLSSWESIRRLQDTPADEGEEEEGRLFT